MRVPLAVVASLLLTPALLPGQQTGANPERAVLEQQVRARAAQITRERLGLTDAQMQQLQRVNSRFGPQLGAVANSARAVTGARSSAVLRGIRMYTGSLEGAQYGLTGPSTHR